MKQSRPVDPAVQEAEWERVRSWTRPEYARLQEPPVSEFDRRRKEAVRKNREASKPIVDELRGVGIPLETLGELANVRIVYPVAAPILLRHLMVGDYPEDVKLTILHALQQPFGPSVFRALVDALVAGRDTLSDRELEYFGNAIAANATKKDAAELTKVISDPSFRNARLFPLLTVARWGGRNADIQAAVKSFFRRHEWDWYGLRALRLAKIWDCADEVTPLLSHTNPDFRAEARAYMKAREKALSREPRGTSGGDGA